MAGSLRLNSGRALQPASLSSCRIHQQPRRNDASGLVPLGSRRLLQTRSLKWLLLSMLLLTAGTGDNPNGERGPQAPTAAQMRALLNLTTQLRSRYAIPLDHVIQHRDVNPQTQCPGDRFPFNQFIEQLREKN